MTTVGKAALVLGVAYIAAISVLFVRGAGILAAYLTMPAWFLVGALSLQTSPGSNVDAALSSWTGNLLMLTVSAALNAAAVYGVVRLFSRTITRPRG